MMKIRDVVSRLGKTLSGAQPDRRREHAASANRVSPSAVPSPTKIVAYPDTGTFYQDELDQPRLARLLPYRVRDRGLSLDQVESSINSEFYRQYGPDYRKKTTAHLSVDSPLDYERLLKSIKAHPAVRFQTLRDGMKSRPSDNEIVTLIRHDLDGDLVAARQLAAIENRLGIPTTYYLLHTAPYYGTLRGKVFVRNASSAKRYLEIQELGHELALHTDGLTLYHDHGIDGAAAIVEELTWLRSRGCRIEGSTAHNSFGVYGANNYSIFEGRPLKLYDEGAKGVVHNGRWAPLQVLNEKALGLDYEAIDFFLQTEIPIFYAALHSQNCWRTDIWYVKGNPKISPELQKKLARYKNRFVSQDELSEIVRELSGTMWLYIVVHPMHYGQRPDGRSAPWVPDAPTDTLRHGARMWAGGGMDGSAEYCAITRLNEFGTPDRGLDVYKSGEFRLAIFGDGNVSSGKVPVDAKVGQVAARHLRQVHRRTRPAAISIGRESWSTSGFQVALRRVDGIGPPDAIVIGARESDPAIGETLLAAEALKKAGRAVVFLIEGGPSLARPASADFVKAVEAKAGCVVVDPYSRMAGYEGSAKLVWGDESGWAPQGHAIAGEMLAEAVVALT